MTIDAYTPCPGGTGKKIKFCCSDFVSELEKIDRMIEGEQYLACLQHIEHLYEQPANRDRQCLLAYQALLLRRTDQLEAAQAHAAAFLQKYPTNQIALAESALLAAGEDNASAMQYLQRALAAAKGSLSWQTYEAAAILAKVYLHQEQWLPARALLQFLLGVEKRDETISAMIIELFRSPEVPLLLKDDPPYPRLPEDTPWKDRFTQALNSIAYGDWLSAERNLTALADDVPESSAVWRILATLRGWLGDASGCIAALNKYASLDVPLEDAVEAQATAMLLSEKPLDDATAVLNVTWTVKDPERLQEALLSEQRIRPINFNPADLASEDSPPPKAVYMLLDRPEPASADVLSAQSMPRLLGQLFFFGRQTDREARLELVGVIDAELGQIKSMLINLAGQWLEGAEKTEEIASVSATEDLLQPHWQPLQAVNAVELNKMLGEYRRDALLERWPEMRLGVLEGRSPREAAGDQRLRIKLLAAILVLQHYADLARCTIDLDELRTKLGLPILESIEPEPGKIGQVPLARLARLKLEKLSDEDLTRAFQRAVGYSHRTAILKFAGEVINRPSFAGRKEQMLAYLSLAHTEADLDRALQYVEAGRQAADARGISHAMWDLEELSLRFARQELPVAVELIRHIQTTHIKEPNISVLLTQQLINVGLLRPDGTVPARPGPKEEEMAAVGTPDAEPGKLWTPNGESSGGSGKLWVPD
jgi:hypothetical protein